MDNLLKFFTFPGIPVKLTLHLFLLNLNKLVNIREAFYICLAILIYNRSK